MADLLNELAAEVPLERMLRMPARPEEAEEDQRSSGSRIHHVATKKLLDKLVAFRPRETKAKEGKKLRHR